MTRKLHIPDLDDIVRRYVSGVSLKQLSDETGYNRPVLLRRLREHGIEVRGRSEAERLKWLDIKRDPARVAAQVSSAHRARRGQRDSLAVKVKRAKAFARTLARLGGCEVVILDELYEAVGGLRFQFAIGPYNVDAACETRRVAVEVQLANVQKPNASVAGKRVKHLLDAGWAVLLVIANNAKRDGFNLSAIREQTVAFFELASRDPSIRGQYGMIGRDGQRIATLRDDLTDLPRVPGF